MSNKDGQGNTPADQNKNQDPFSELFKNGNPDNNNSNNNNNNNGGGNNNNNQETAEQKAEREKKEAEEKARKAQEDAAKNQNNLENLGTRVERGAEATDFLNTDEGKIFSKYSKEIREAAKDPRWFNIPVSQLPAIILKPSAYADTLAEAKKKADLEAEDSVTGGASHLNNVPEELKKIDPKTMSKEDFQTLVTRAKHGDFLIKK